MGGRPGRARFGVLGVAVAVLVVVGCGRVATETSVPANGSIRKTVEGLVLAARTTGLDGETATADGAAEWNEVVSLMSTTKSAVTHVEFIDGDVLAVVLDDGEFTPFGGQSVTAVQISSETETWCYRPSEQALVSRPCLAVD